MANLVPKIPAQTWLATARRTLISQGIAAVKVDQLARQLKVSRGGFYHHFSGRDDLLERLLAEWQTTVVFVPETALPRDPASALRALDDLFDRLINEKGYDSAFDWAVRSWSHADADVARAVTGSDARRIRTLTKIFLALGCDAQEAAVRARVLYFHQIGYYAIGVQESHAVRLRRAQTYLQILCGEAHLERARAWKPARAASHRA